MKLSELLFKKRQILFFVLFSFLSSLSAQKFPCDGRLMVINAFGNGNVYSLKIDRQNLTCTTGEPLVELETPLHIWNPEAIGYRWKNQTFYGTILYQSSTHIDLFSIDKDGNFAINYVSGPELEDAFAMISGCVSNDQQHLLLIENLRESPNQASPPDPTRPNLLHKINLESGNYEFETIMLHGIAASDTVGIFSGDIAIDPVTGIGYSIDVYTRRMVTIDLNSGEVDNASYPPINFEAFGGTIPGSLFFDSFNRLYGLSHKYFSDNIPEESHLYEFDKETGTIINAFNFYPPSDTAKFDDGCSCPFTVALEKELKTASLRQCQATQAVIRAAFLNEEILEPVNFRDSFPPGVEIQEVLYNPYGGSVSGIGTHILEIEGLQPRHGVDSIIVEVFIPEQMAGGDYYCQASISGLDLSEMGDSRTSAYSDYLPSPAYNDATPFSLTELVSLSPALSFEICEGESRAIRPLENTQGLGFLWEDGSTADSLVVNKPGLYDVTIDTGCETFDYTVEVTQSELSVDLGGDLPMLFGETAALTPVVQSSSPIVSYLWNSSDTAALSCLHCPTNELAPLQGMATVSLQVINESNCTAADEITITVDRPVYVPTAFSPNGDGRNDCFMIHTPAETELEYFRVYGRWGGLVWESKDGSTNSSEYSWDGTSGGKVVAVGLYTWSARLLYADGQKAELSGEVSLIR